MHVSSACELFQIVDVGRSRAYIFEKIPVHFETFETLIQTLTCKRNRKTSDYIELHSSWL